MAAVIYTYFALSLDDLRKLAEFAESPPGRWYYETVWTATQEAFDAIAIRFHSDLVGDIAQLESQGGS